MGRFIYITTYVIENITYYVDITHGVSLKFYRLSRGEHSKRIILEAIIAMIIFSVVKIIMLLMFCT